MRSMLGTAAVYATLSFAPVCVAAGEPMDEVLARLASPDLSVREEAARALSGRADADLKTIEGLLTRPDLSAEQRLRLLHLASVRFRETPRGALGVSFGFGPGSDGLMISAPLANFPAAKVLRPGDRIVAVDGEVIPSSSGFGWSGNSPIRPFVISRDPGDTVRLTIIRPREAPAINLNQANGRAALPPIIGPTDTIEVDVALGSFDELRNNNAGLSEDDLAAAWTHREARMTTKLAGEVIRPDTAQNWGSGLRSIDEAGFDGVSRSVVAGGEPAPSELSNNGWPSRRAGRTGITFNGGANGRMVIQNGQGPAQVFVLGPNGDWVPADRPQTRNNQAAAAEAARQRLAALMMQQRTVEAQMTVIKTQINAIQTLMGNLPAGMGQEQRQSIEMLKMMYDEQEAELASLQEQIIQVQAAVSRAGQPVQPAQPNADVVRP
ncbi:MAG: hypothetical protein LW650_02350 [Planctomycetaceae bacterium]|jgi:hypothetical protein|nr:PDZ domain-containing protein [Phycisphaerales bacterium]MCE2652367.1 hypothetical protein [Planctomycetaceae bacterium]